MLVSELVAAATFLREFLEKRELVQRLQELMAAVTVTAKNNDSKALDVSLQRLEKLHADAELAAQRLATRRLIDHFGGSSLLGTAAMQRIRAAFDNHRANPPAIVAALQAMANETGALAKRARRFVESLGPMLDDVSEPQLASNEGRVWLFFEHNASVETMSELRDVADDWGRILHHFSRVHPGVAATARLVSVQKSSPLVIQVAAHVAILSSLLWAVDRVVTTLSRVVELRKKHEELKQLKLKTSILEDIAGQIRHERANVADQTADELKDKFNCENEARNAVRAALDEIIKFIEAGGELDVDVPVADSDSDSERVGDGETARPDIRALIANVRKEFLALPPFDDDREQN